jgi:hypothetical protein
MSILLLPPSSPSFLLFLSSLIPLFPFLFSYSSACHESGTWRVSPCYPSNFEFFNCFLFDFKLSWIFLLNPCLEFLLVMEDLAFNLPSSLWWIVLWTWTAHLSKLATAMSCPISLHSWYTYPKLSGPHLSPSLFFLKTIQSDLLAKWNYISRGEVGSSGKDWLSGSYWGLGFYPIGWYY